VKVLEYIQSESDRQSATLQETVGMLHAWEYVRHFQGPPNLDTIKHISHLITGNSEFRKVPAVFNQGRPAINAQLIPRAMMHWNDWSAANPFSEQELDGIMQEFLEIHPFADGNGRVASLLYNFYRGSILDPVPLPYYFGEEASAS
jgi:hypothetical protein